MRSVVWMLLSREGNNPQKTAPNLCGRVVELHTVVIIFPVKSLYTRELSCGEMSTPYWSLLHFLFEREFALVKAAIFLLAATMLAACDAEPAPLVTVSEARAIALPTSAAVYFTLANSGGRDRLLSVTAEAGRGTASLHETIMDGDIMRMRAIEGIEIPARGQVLLSANGRHVMIQDLARPLAAGSSVRLTLSFERQGAVTIEAPVSGPR